MLDIILYFRDHNRLNKTSMKILTKLIALTTIFFCAVACDQTYVVSGYKNNEVSASKLQQYKAEALGSKITLEFYNEDVKLTIHLSNNEKPKYFVLSKNDSGAYTCTEGKYTIVLELNTFLKFITGGKISNYNNGNLVWETTFEREWLF